jgi:hypothetical protein
MGQCLAAAKGIDDPTDGKKKKAGDNSNTFYTILDKVKTPGVMKKYFFHVPLFHLSSHRVS